MKKNAFLLAAGIILSAIAGAILAEFENANAQVSSGCQAAAGDAINSITYNPDGSVDAFVQFTNGSGIKGVTDIHLPVPQPITAGIPPVVVTAAVPWTNSNVVAGLTPLAAAAKASWIQAISGASPIGTTTAFSQ